MTRPGITFYPEPLSDVEMTADLSAFYGNDGYIDPFKNDPDRTTRRETFTD